jgi:hypothetical protein
VRQGALFIGGGVKFVFSVGWMVQWVAADNTKHFDLNGGLVGYTDTPPESFIITSRADSSTAGNTDGSADIADGGFLSVLWAGITEDTLSVRKVIHINDDDSHVTVTVTLKNVGSGPITELYCKF